MLLDQAYACDIADDVGELVDRDHTVLAEVQGLGVIGAHEFVEAGDAVVDVAERARLLSVAPDFDRRPPSSFAWAILRHSAAGAFSRPPSQVPSGPKMLWNRTIRVSMP